MRLVIGPRFPFIGKPHIQDYQPKKQAHKYGVLVLAYTVGIASTKEGAALEED